jgi:hypothetical protein
VIENPVGDASLYKPGLNPRKLQTENFPGGSKADF